MDAKNLYRKWVSIAVWRTQKFRFLFINFIWQEVWPAEPNALDAQVTRQARRRRSSRYAGAMCVLGVWRSYQIKFEIWTADLLALRRGLAIAPRTTSTIRLVGEPIYPSSVFPRNLKQADLERSAERRLLWFIPRQR